MLPAVINGRRASSSSTVFARTSAVSTDMKLSPSHTDGALLVAAATLQRSPPVQLTSLSPADEHPDPAARSLPHAHVAQTASRSRRPVSMVARAGGLGATVLGRSAPVQAYDV